MSDVRELHRFAVTLAEDAAHTIAGSRPTLAGSHTKADAGDWVTPFDRAIEADMRERIARAYPGHAIVGEELGGREPAHRADVTWHLDPIDGTLNFVHGLTWVAFSLAAVDAAGMPLAGVVADAYRGEVFSAIRGGGAFVDGVPIRCSTASSLEGGVFLTEWSRQSAWPGMQRYLERISALHAGTRIMGSCALALALVGAGRVSGTVLPGRYNSWDVLAGALIAREGGATIYGRDGERDGVPMDGILAAAPQVAPALWHAWIADDR